MAALDSLDLARRLIRCPSVTPAEGGALDLLQEALEGLGFRCRRLVFSEAGTPDVDNLYARLGAGGRNFCYAGHTDVVPPGDPAAWTHDPFAAELEDGWLYGRGAVDMKGAIAAYLAALSRFLEARGAEFGGSLSLLITGDEEGPAVNGTRKALAALARDGERLDACLVGEPTSAERLGDTVKIGRRGALNARLRVTGVQGHSAYAHLADNPVHRLLAMLTRLTGEPLCQGSDHFQPTSLQVTTVDVGNPATNVIPREATAGFDVRFSDRHTSATVERWLRERLDAVGGDYELTVRVSGESFLSPPGPLSELIAGAVAEVTGRPPELGTTGGTSDARFIKDHAPVAELGL
ncbi:MAG: succinyl-diaminopimelate desuccinylase, partial [Kiloniellales bacterium]|nr:succinyl-diaminopimelate desuccinylase [Kiloniellales bacterium]